MDNPLAAYDHPAWITAVATLIAYGGILVGLLIIVFLIPYAIFLAL